MTTTTENLIEKMREAGVPELLIPKLLPRLKQKLDAKNWLVMQEESAAEAKKRQEDYIDKEKREAFSLWLIFLLMLLMDDQPNPVSFFHEAYRKMYDQHAQPNPVIGEDAFIERSLTAVAMLKFSRADVEEALQIGQPTFEDTVDFRRGKVTKVFPMTHAIRAIEQSQQQQAAAAPAPAAATAPAPAAPAAPAPAPAIIDQEDEELKINSVAYPNF